MSIPFGKSLTSITQRMSKWFRLQWQQSKEQHFGLPKIRDWLYELMRFVRHSRAFQVAVFFYVIISLLQAWQLQTYASTMQIQLLRFSNQPFALCVRYPTHLTLDGDTRHGLVTLRLVDSMTNGVCPKTQPGLLGQFMDWWKGQPLPVGTTSPMTATMTIIATQVTTSPVVTGTLVTQTPILTITTTSTSSAPSTSSVIVTTSPTTMITTTGQLSTASNLSGNLSPLAFQQFKLEAMDNLLFIDKEEIAYSPEITLTRGQEKSIIIAHAQLENGENTNLFSVNHVASNEFSQPIREIKLEQYGWPLWRRKLLEILLAPVTGGLLALVAVGLEEVRKREEERQKRDEERQKKDEENQRKHQEEEQKQIEERQKKESEEQARKNQERELREFCEQTVTNCQKSNKEEFFRIIQDWLDRFEGISAELKSDSEIQKALQQSGKLLLKRYILLAKTHLLKFKDSNSEESKMKNRVTKLSQDDGMNTDGLKNYFIDLEFVIQYLRGTKTTEPHKFFDAELAGFYANHRWFELKVRESTISKELQYLQERLEKEEEIFINVFEGVFNCEQLFPAKNTLLQELGQYYVTSEYQSEYQEAKAPDDLWWPELLKVIDRIEHNNLDLAQWCQEKRNEKARYEDNQHRIALGQRPKRALWPLELPKNVDKLFDANYDFPSIGDDIDDIAIQTPYSPNSGTEAEAISAFDICQNYLSYRNHCIVAGARKAGKSWLRLYLEYFSFNIEERLFPLFYFAPATLAYQTNVRDIVKNLARSVANQLFADLLVRSGYRTPMNDPLRASRVAIVAFLRQYGYMLPLDDDSLAQPIPSQHVLDIELAYKKSYLGALYAQMKQGIGALPDTQTTLTVEGMLDDIQHAFELAGYQYVFVLVDNWEDLPALPRQRLLQQLLHTDLLQQLYQHGIFLKLFMPEIADSTLSHFSQVCEIQREALPKLTLYIQGDPNA